jgi:hypothetical protein
MYLIAFPLLLIPFALYNMVIFLLNLPVTDTVFTIPLLEGRRIPVTTGEIIVGIALLMLYFEAVKAARGSKGGMDHVLALILFAGMAAELALVPKATTPTLLLLTAISFIDVITGLTIARRPKQEIVLEAPSVRLPETPN